MAETRIIDFNKLPKATRERLIGCLSGQFSPRPILSDRFSSSGTVGWVMLLLACGATLLMLASYGFGSAYNSGSVQGPIALLLYVAAIFFGVYSIVSIIRRTKLRASLPFMPGRYLFPMDFIDARDKTLRIVPLASLVDLQAVHHHTNGVYSYTLFTLTFEGGKAETFSLNNKGLAEAALNQLRSERAALGQAVQDRNVEVIAALDPFFEVRINDAWDKPLADKPFEQGPTATDIPAWLKKGALVSLAPAILFGPIVWYVRNRLSDDSMFEEAKARNTEDAFESYLWHGKRHADEVRNEWIWKAALADAEKKGTSADLRAFLKKYPDAPVAKEIQNDKLPRLALNEAKTQGTVSALRDFLKEFPGSVVDADAKGAIHKLFADTLAAFKPQASTKDPKMLPFIERLVKYMEAQGSPPVKVSFRIIKSPSLALADKLLQSKEPDTGSVPGLALGGTGSVAAASSHFSEERSGTREGAIVKVLQQSFATIFPADVLPLQEGERRSDASDKNAVVSAPTIEIDYEVGWSGSTYTSEKSGREFVGIKIDFQTAMRLPGEPDKETLRFKLRVEPPEHFTVNYQALGNFLDTKYLNNAGPSDSTVYEVMAARAFDQLSTQLKGVFFKEDSDAFGNTAAGKIPPASKGGKGSPTPL